MSVVALAGIRKAVQNLNPGKVRELGERELNIALYAHSNEAYRQMEEFFLEGLFERRRKESLDALTRGPAPAEALKYDFAIYDEGVVAPARAFVFHRQEPDLLVKRILSKHEELGVPLARHFEVFRRPYVEHLIKKISRENALFSIATALPDVIPSFIELPWAIAEFTSDTAFITMNQIRMAFLLAAASDRQVGYMEQKSEIAGVIGSAFGWRALARQVAGKIPFGAGCIRKPSNMARRWRNRFSGPCDRTWRTNWEPMMKQNPQATEPSTPKPPHARARGNRSSLPLLALAMLNAPVRGYAQRRARTVAA